MAKKSSVNISAVAVIRTIVFLLIGMILFSVYTHTVEFLTSSELFKIKDVLIDSSIQFIDVRALRQLKGCNIFKVDTKKLERQIAGGYPMIAKLRIVREFPDRIKVLAKRRDALLQIPVRGKFLLVDTEGVALYYSFAPAALPQVKGIPLARGKVVLGARLLGQELNKVVDILNMFKASPILSKWHISAVEAGNLSKIDITVGEGAHVIVDQDNTERKVELLQMLAVGNKINLAKVKYMDVRFKEPLIAANKK